jgi:hypothetical protein
MSTEMNLDSLVLLRARVAELEAAEAATLVAAASAKKKANAMDRLQAILAEKNQALARNRYSKSIPLAAYYDQQDATLIDTLIDIIDGLHNRIAQLEEDKVKAAVAAAASS